MVSSPKHHLKFLAKAGVDNDFDNCLKMSTEQEHGAGLNFKTGK